MKNIVLVAVIMLLACNVFAQDYSHCYTNGFRNGRAYFQNEDFIEKDTNSYITGCLDALGIFNREAMIKLYPRYCTHTDIINAVKAYYKNNPTQASRPIIDVIMTGCK